MQLHVHPRVSTVVQPILRLAGFRRIELEAGEPHYITFPVGQEARAIPNNPMRCTVETGLVDIMVSPSAADTTSVQLELHT
ncbi:fibronectin type III-like domain-contianing protein [Frankia umida]|uniref:fibronectin type III-like domain-contianing protein n=1 Tax=Frankia umida TaxID=573489 RepID=UPI00355874BC